MDEGAAPRRIAILGGGFAGLAAARALAKAPLEITLVDRSNHHVFQPLLYQVATAGLAPSDIGVPIRWRLRRQKNVRVLRGNVARIDADGKALVLEDGHRIEYDRLILAAGARHHYFGNPEWEPHAPGLKTIEDALEIRNRFLEAFERAERETDPTARDAWMTVVIVGGGPTGVELAGVLPSMLKRALAPEFRNADLRRAKVVLIEAGERLLPAFHEASSARALADLESLGVEVRLGSTVTSVDAGGVHLGETHIPARTVFWAAGNRASPRTTDLGTTLRRDGRIEVNPDLSVPGRPEIFAVGDLAWVPRGDGEVPAVAPAAVQMGRAAARAIRADLEGRPRPEFRYFDKGSLATIGRHRAVAEFGAFRFAGFVAWWLWLFVHILYLVGFRNRLSVLIEWAYAYWTYQRGVRLITDPRNREAEPE